MNHSTPFNSIEEIAKLYASEEAPDYAADGSTNMSINVSPQMHRNVKQLSLDTGAPIAWLFRHAVEAMYSKVLTEIERRYE